MNLNANEISATFLNQVKLQQPTKAVRITIQNLSKKDLDSALISQEDRLTFWLNLYNAFFQVIVKEHPEWFKNKMKLFFGKHIIVAHQKMSLDDIEHNMLRKSTYKWSLGYIRKPFPSAFENAYQVKQLDPRIHFALNCGAVSCPPIRFYTSENVHEQLDIATVNFLNQDVLYDSEKRTVSITKLFNWFRGDFGGKRGARKILKKYEVTPVKPKSIKFTTYDWTLLLDNYREIKL